MTMDMTLNNSKLLAKLGDLLLFLLMSWAILYLWLVLLHLFGENDAATLLSSPLISICIGASLIALLLQNTPGAIKELLIIAFWLVAIFLYLILIFNLLLCITPDIYDAIFYYECYAILFFGGSPLYLILRLI